MSAFIVCHMILWHITSRKASESSKRAIELVPSVFGRTLHDHRRF